ncbi:hypothetical protein [Crateriforma conspicua]|uniref:Uncharacterized protein n=1 Tax=Crateriforma conspicua TaxID=2527996 RepID=A0A5C5Y1Z6_9PLAN|nr:hypothetical protein [Crateriforma conspicua]QDV63828.1 hypothetical protein Mal65_29750 [Crateriforma conspicua]TWT69190.1 hypothetical protein Pan14r_14750 [Crateriforma conspicua]
MYWKNVFLAVVALGHATTAVSEMPSKDKAVVAALLSREADYLRQFESGAWEMVFRSEYVNELSRARVHGVATWCEEQLRIDYNWKRVKIADTGGEQSTSRRGTMLKSGKTLVDYYRDRDLAFRSIEGAKQSSQELKVLPKENWFMYAFEFPYSDLWTDNGKWNFAHRSLSTTNVDGQIRIAISHSEEGTNVSASFLKGEMPLVSSVEHRLRGNLRYATTLTWDESEKLLYPSLIEEKRYDRQGLPWRTWKIEVESLKQINSSLLRGQHFTERGIGITSKTRTTTYRKNQRPVTKAGTKDLDLQKAIETLRNSDFSK